jgi:DNA-binding response OmpR family regulator
MISILFIDDDPLLLSFFEDALTRKGYEVHATSDPAEGEKIIAAHKIDLVILDVVMPEKSGLEVFDSLKKQFNNMPILFATGQTDSFSRDSDNKPQYWIDVFSEGMTDFIFKPFTIDRLDSKIQGLLENASYSL